MGEVSRDISSLSVSPQRRGERWDLKPALLLLVYEINAGDGERHHVVRVYLLTEESVGCTFFCKKKATEQYVH